MIFETPILLIVFNRPKETYAVFDQICKIKPKYLYIASDGPRKDHKTDKLKCDEVKSIFEKIDWDCEIKTFYNEKNIGCKLAVSGAIKWFFNNVDCGIVLEDDCVPDLSFFKYCEELLFKYKDDTRIGIITGRNENSSSKLETSYNFSTAGSIWGWASWKRVISQYDVDDKSILENFKENIYNATLDKFERKRLFYQLKWVFENHLNTWDYQFHSMLKLNSMLYIVPSYNLIKNIGFNSQATHTTSLKDKRMNVSSKQIQFPLNHPRYILPNRMISKSMVRADSNSFILFSLLILNNWIKKKLNIGSRK